MLMYLYRVGTSSRILVNTVPCKAMTTYSGHKFYKVRLSWPNRSFGFFCNILWKKLVNILANPVFLCLNVYTLSLAMPQESVQRRQWHPTPVLLPGKSHGQRSLVGCSPWGRKSQIWLSNFTFTFHFFMHWRRRWQPTPVFLSGESQGWGLTESDTTESSKQRKQSNFSPKNNVKITLAKHSVNNPMSFSSPNYSFLVLSFIDILTI